MNKRIWLTLIACTILVPGVPGRAVAQIDGPESRTGAALPVCESQLCAQLTLFIAGDTAAKVAIGREVRPQAAIPGPKIGGTFQEIDFPGALQTSLEGINPQGDIVGVYLDGSFNIHNFLLSKGIFSDIDPPGVRGPSAVFLTTQMGINPQGDIVGNYTDSNGAHGFLLSKGIYTSIDAPGASQLSFGTWASGINPKGEIVGFYFDASGNSHGFLLSKGTYTNIDVPGAFVAFNPTAINPQGDILGIYQEINSGSVNGFLLSSKGTFSTIDVPAGSSFTFLLGMNPRGDIVGVGSESSFLLSHGTVTTILVPASSLTEPYGINPQGDIVGCYGGSDGIMHGFLRTP